MLIYSLILILKFHRKYSCITSALCFGTLAGVLLIPLFYYTYTSILGKNLFILDISTFILSIVIAFWLSYKLTLSCRLEPYTSILCILVCIIFVCFLVFSYHPPNTTIFQDPTVSKTNETNYSPGVYFSNQNHVLNQLSSIFRNHHIIPYGKPFH